MPLILRREGKGCRNNVLADLIQTDIPGDQNFARMPPAVFDLFEEHIHHCIQKEVIIVRKPLEVGLKLEITLRHLATGETNKSLQYHWLVGQTVPTVCRAILAVNSLRSICLTLQKTGNRSRSSEPDGISPTLLGD